MISTTSLKHEKKRLFIPSLKISPKQKILNQILLGDCVKWTKSFPPALKFDLIIADPPYNVGKDFGNNRDCMSLEDYANWSEAWIKLCLQRLKEDGLLYVYGFAEVLAHISVRFSSKRQRWLTWHYTNKTVPSLKFWQRSFESIICFWKDKRPALEVDQIREPYSPAYKNCIGKKRKGTRGRFGSRETVYNGHEKGALPRDVLKIPALAGGKGFVERSPLKHPTQKPLELSKRLIQSKINGSGGKVLIPFAGSGSECVAAKSLGVDFVGIELNPDYVKAGREWLRSIA